MPHKKFKDATKQEQFDHSVHYINLLLNFIPSMT